MNTSTQKPQDPDFDPSPEFIARKKRIDDAMNLRKPDRVPVVPLTVNYYPTRARGISNKDALYNPENTFKIITETTVQHNWDAGGSAAGSLIALRPLEILGIKQIRWPGGSLSDEQPYKWVENEYMMQDEYDELLTEPNGFVVKKIWPRISETLVPVSGFCEHKPFSFLYGSSAFTLPFLLGEKLSSESVVRLLKKALELAEEYEKSQRIVISNITEMRKRGYDMHSAGMAYPAFDWISINLRGLRGILLDMYEVPDKLQAALELITRSTIEDTIMDAKMRGGKRVTIRMNRNAVEFMDDDQFMTFYWPYFKSLILGLIKAGITPIPIFEGDYTSKLELLAEFPPGKIVGHFDKIDRKKAKKIIGNVMCFWGNVPAKLLCEGTVQKVKDDVKELIETFGDNGGLIIDGAGGIPDKARPENVQALTDAAHEYGVY
jgi:uroporphyrinogen-III decarboxylase